MKGHIRARGERSWEITIDIGKDPVTGKRRQRWYTVPGTKKDAEKELTRLLHSLHTGAYVENHRLTLAEYLQHWLDDYARVNVSAKTIDRYAEIVRIHLTPALGSIPLVKLMPTHIQGYYSEALQAGRRNGTGGGLSAQTVLHHRRVLREALGQAVKWQLLQRNPAEAVDPPRPQHKEMQAFNEGEISKLLELSRDSWLFLPILIAATTGLRRGEILALRWQDVDLQAGTLAVRQSLEQTRHGIPFKQPKTKKSCRVVALPPTAVQALRRQKVAQARDRLLMGAGYQDHGLVCAHQDGTPHLPDSLTQGFGRLVQRAGIHPGRFHDLRHSHATLLLRQGIHPKVVSERLGHANIGITLDTYSHVLPGMQQEAAQKMESLLKAGMVAGL